MNVQNLWKLDQQDYWYPRKMYLVQSVSVNGELSSCDITYSGRVSSREGNIQNCIIAYSVLLNRLSKAAQTFTVGFVKLLSSHPIHIVVWGNFPFNVYQKILSSWKKIPVTLDVVASGLIVTSKAQNDCALLKWTTAIQLDFTSKGCSSKSIQRRKNC